MTRLLHRRGRGQRLLDPLEPNVGATFNQDAKRPVQADVEVVDRREDVLVDAVADVEAADSASPLGERLGNPPGLGQVGHGQVVRHCRAEPVGMLGRKVKPLLQALHEVGVALGAQREEAARRLPPCCDGDIEALACGLVQRDGRDAREFPVLPIRNIGLADKDERDMPSVPVSKPACVLDDGRDRRPRDGGR